MKILHVCLAAFYIDGFGYQENILPRIHRDIGHDVEIIASTETYLRNTRLGYVEPSSYVSPDGLRVTRLAYHSWFPKNVVRKLRIYQGLEAELHRFRPDIIFIHDLQFLSAGTIVRYAKESGAVVYADTHTDYINSGRSAISLHLLHGLLYRYSARQIESVAKRIYATLPLRKEFLVDVYGMKGSGISLLPFGADDSRIDRASRGEVRASVRRELDLEKDDIVFVTGGKIDIRKNIHLLLKVFCSMVDDGRLSKAKLIVFGIPNDETAPLVRNYLSHASVRYLEWVPSEELYRFIWAADLAVFPGTHSVLWEEVVGLGLPCIARRWRGIEHIDLGGNCAFLDRADEAEISEQLLRVHGSASLLAQMTQVAAARGPEVFSYTSIAKRAIDFT